MGVEGVFDSLLSSEPVFWEKSIGKELKKGKTQAIITQIALCAITAAVAALIIVTFSTPPAITALVIGCAALKIVISIQSFMKALPLKAALHDWIQDPAATGNKEEGARRILEAYYKKDTHLHLSNLNLNSIPPEISMLTQLVEIQLRNNNLVSIPESLADLPQLGIIFVGGNQAFQYRKTIDEHLQVFGRKIWFL